MSEYAAIENMVTAALVGLQVDGSKLLGTAKGQTSRERKVLVAGLLRERLPAAYVTITGRDIGEKLYRRAGGALLTVLYAARSERRDDEARLGGPESAGVLGIAEHAAVALQGLDLAQNRRLYLLDERAAGGEQGTAIWEQHYQVRRQSSPYLPTFGAVSILGDAGEVQVEVGELQRAASTFSFPGVDGVFERFAGTRDRRIVWTGQLRADSDSQLNEIEARLEQLVGEARPDILADPWGRSFHNCVAKSFKRVGPRAGDNITGQVLQGFEFHFVQLAE